MAGGRAQPEPGLRARMLADVEDSPVRIAGGVLLAASLAWGSLTLSTTEAGALLVGPAAAVVGTSGGLLLAQRRPRLAAWLIVLGAVLAMGYAIGVTEHTDPRFVGGLVLPVFLAGLLLGPLALVGTALLAIAVRGALALFGAELGVASLVAPLSPLAFWLHTSLLLLTIAVVGAIALLRWQRVAERARKSEEIHRLLADNAADVIWTVNADRSLAYVSPACERVLGFTPEQQMQRHAQGKLVADRRDLERLHELSARLESGAIDEYTIEMEQLHAERGSVWCEIHVRGVRDADGRYLGAVGVTRDVSRRRAMELANDRLRRALDQAVEAIAVIGPDGRTEFSNRAYAELTPASEPGEARSTIERVLEGPLGEARAAIARGHVWRDRVERILHGRRRVFDTSLTPVRDASGQALGTVSVTRDVTREAELEAEIQLAQKMQALGQLAGGIAHDFNNLLAVISGYAELLSKRHADDATTLQDLSEISEAAELASSLTRQLLVAGRRTVGDPRPVDVGQALRGLEKVLRSVVREDVELGIHVRADSPLVVEIEPDQLRLVLVNLATNARDAMPEGGRLEIRLRGERVERLGESARDEVLLEVEDTGCGIPDAEQERIFEPFYTTKSAGRGSGLGLAGVYWAVSRAKGRIAVSSRPGCGALFRVWLPRAGAAGAEADPGAAAGVGRRAPGTALIVEDQAQVRAMLRRAIEADGWQVLEAESGASAIALIESADASPDVLLTDVVMPGMSGIALASQLRRRNPALHVILASGYPSNAMSSLGPELAGARFLHKPFRLSEVSAELRASRG